MASPVEAAVFARETFVQIRAAGVSVPLVLTLVCEHQKVAGRIHVLNGHHILHASFLGRVVPDGSPYRNPDGVVIRPGEPDPDIGSMARYRNQVLVIPQAGIFDRMTTYELVSDCCTVPVALSWLRKQLHDTPARRRLVVPANR